MCGILRTSHPAGSSSLDLPDVPGDFGQIIAELVSAAVGDANGRAREVRFIQGEVLERHLLVVAAVVEEHLQSFGELRCEVLSQRILVQLSAPGSHVGRSDEEQPGDGLLWLLFGEVLEQDESAHRVPDQDHLAVHRGEFF